MQIPDRIVSGLGRERVGRIRMAWDFAVTKLPALSAADRERLAELVVLESRDDTKSIGEIAVTAIQRLREA